MDNEWLFAYNLPPINGEIPVAAISCRKDNFERIVNGVTQQVFYTTVQHIAIPVIVGFSGEEMSSEIKAQLGKPVEVLRADQKFELYRRMCDFYKPILVDTIKRLVKQILSTSLASWTDAQLDAKAVELSQMNQIKKAPKWKIFPLLVGDCAFLFRRLQTKLGLELDPVLVHQHLCPIVYRDKEQLAAKIGMKEILQNNQC